MVIFSFRNILKWSFFIFKKIIFNISISKRSKNIKKIILNKKNKIFGHEHAEAKKHKAQLQEGKKKKKGIDTVDCKMTVVESDRPWAQSLTELQQL
jgi:hypothetical protein